MALVILVVFAFLRSVRAAAIPSVAVPTSIIGSFGVMYLLGFSLNNLSLMALTVATGFVVDDAIVMLENITRHIENGVAPFEAALRGAREVSFTVLSMSLSLVAVFLPVLLMPGIVGRVFREFALTLTSAILLSLVISLTVTPMMCAHLLGPHRPKEGWFMRGMDRGFNAMRDFYARTLQVALDHPRVVISVLGITVLLNFYLFVAVPKGFFPEEDTGSVQGMLMADQSISFQALEQKLRTAVTIVKDDPAVADVVGFTGGRGGNTANMFIDLKPLSQRHMDSAQVIARLRQKLSGMTGARLYMQVVQDIRAGGRQSNAEYQYTLLADNLDQLRYWVPRITAALKQDPALRDVNSDQQNSGLDVRLNIDRTTASRLGVNLTEIDNTLYDAFGQRQVSTIYNDMNQYHVVMEVAPKFWQNPDTLRDIWISTAGGALNGSQATADAVGAFRVGSSSGTSAGNGTGASATTVADTAARNAQLNALTNSGRGGASTGTSLSTRAEDMVPLAAFASYGPGLTPMQVAHQGAFTAATISFNLPVGGTLGQATAAIQRTMQQLHVP
ncbi:MAG: efflux RND transporter permease subunit, partial [Steroidobacteraceae bacterium]